MDEQLDDVLARAAGDPPTAVDVDDVRRRVRRRRRRRLAGGGGASLLIVGIVAAGAVMLGSGQAPIDVVLDPQPPSVASPANGATATPSPGDRECPARQNPSEERIRWVDFVVFNGRRYEAIRREHELTRQDLGRGLGETVCRYSQVDRDAYGDPKHGDASLLPPGTPLFALPHTDTGFRLAAATDDGVRLYEVHRAPEADTGADVYDLDHVTRIEVRDWSSQDVLGALGRSETLDSLVADLRASRVVDHPYPLPSDEGARYRVVLHLSDGPPVELGLYPAHDLAWPLLHVPGSFTAAILDLLEPPSPTEHSLLPKDARPAERPSDVAP